MKSIDIDTTLMGMPALAAGDLFDWLLSSDGFFGRGTDGPTFLAIYAAVGGVLWIAAFVTGKLTDSGSVPGSIAAVIFAAIGLLRLYVGYQAGMRRFSFLIMMMMMGVATLMAASRAADDDA